MIGIHHLIAVVVLVAGFPAGILAQPRAPSQHVAGDIRVAVAIDDKGLSVVTLTHASGRVVPVKQPLNFTVQSAERASSSRVVLRSIEFSWNQAAIVDANSGEVIDELFFDRSEASPSGRYLAIEPATPRWADPMSAVYFVYDASLSAEENRMGSGSTTFKSFQGGWAVYPVHNVVNRTYRSLIFSYDADSRPSLAQLREVHYQKSAMIWLSDVALAFVDKVDGRYHAVVIDISNGVQSSRRTTALLPTSVREDDYVHNITASRTDDQWHLQLDVRSDSAAQPRVVKVAMPKGYRQN